MKFLNRRNGLLTGEGSKIVTKNSYLFHFAKINYVNTFNNVINIY